MSALTQDELRRIVEAADERAVTADEIAMVEQTLAKVSVMSDDDYRHVAAMVVLCGPIAARGDITRPRVVTVRSETNAKLSYRLRRIGSAWMCSCPGYQHRQRCKHSDRLTGQVSLAPAQPHRVTRQLDDAIDNHGGVVAAIVAGAL